MPFFPAAHRRRRGFRADRAHVALQAAGRAGYDRAMPERLYFTESDEANAMIASDPLALLVGFVLDQQVTVQQAFAGPLALRERLGGFDAQTLASPDPEPVFRQKPAIHRHPQSIAQRGPAPAVHGPGEYDGHAPR